MAPGSSIQKGTLLALQVMSYRWKTSHHLLHCIQLLNLQPMALGNRDLSAPCLHMLWICQPIRRKPFIGSQLLNRSKIMWEWIPGHYNSHQRLSRRLLNLMLKGWFVNALRISTWWTCLEDWGLRIFVVIAEVPSIVNSLSRTRKCWASLESPITSRCGPEYLWAIEAFPGRPLQIPSVHPPSDSWSEDGIQPWRSVDGAYETQWTCAWTLAGRYWFSLVLPRALKQTG